MVSCVAAGGLSGGASRDSSQGCFGEPPDSYDQSLTPAAAATGKGATALRMGGGGNTSSSSRGSSPSPTAPASPVLPPVSDSPFKIRRTGGQTIAGKQGPPWTDFDDGAMEALLEIVPDAGVVDGRFVPEPAIYFIGIIDILTDWTCAKASENWFKTLQHPHTPSVHSCVPPRRYADRFERAMRKWFA